MYSVFTKCFWERGSVVSNGRSVSSRFFFSKIWGLSVSALTEDGMSKEQQKLWPIDCLWDRLLSLRLYESPTKGWTRGCSAGLLIIRSSNDAESCHWWCRALSSRSLMRGWESGAQPPEQRTDNFNNQPLYTLFVDRKIKTRTLAHTTLSPLLLWLFTTLSRRGWVWQVEIHCAFDRLTFSRSIL